MVTFLGTFLYASARKESKNSSLTILLFFLRTKRISLKDSKINPKFYIFVNFYLNLSFFV
ncbi:hypothetical protein BpHYR1_006766 [Brachionus plicatilis]|uniref:Uncharacterized protein n=1 Tax=Brachionus plicatilis TaxID=10195 RepID=A0A3M7PX15_BRAPC|nr:hypothetical protein BpHYR1_006766 [Brachionus plicatilis]